MILERPKSAVREKKHSSVNLKKNIWFIVPLGCWKAVSCTEVFLQFLFKVKWGREEEQSKVKESVGEKEEAECNLPPSVDARCRPAIWRQIRLITGPDNESYIFSLCSNWRTGHDAAFRFCHFYNFGMHWRYEKRGSLWLVLKHCRAHTVFQLVFTSCLPSSAHLSDVQRSVF